LKTRGENAGRGRDTTQVPGFDELRRLPTRLLRRTLFFFYSFLSERRLGIINTCFFIYYFSKIFHFSCKFRKPLSDSRFVRSVAAATISLDYLGEFEK
jgi:hypothetical protein